MSSGSTEGKKSNGNGGALLPILALLCAQLFTSSWHVLGKHVMHQVPYLAPISYVYIRTLVSCLALLIVGLVHEGRKPFPPLFRDGTLMKPSPSSFASIESGNSIGLPLSQSNSTNSLYSISSDKKVEDVVDPSPTLSPRRKHYHDHHHHRPRRKKRAAPTFKNYSILAIRSLIPSIWMMMRNILITIRYYQQQINNLNPEAVQIIFAGLSGMLLLPTCYTTGLILTSPTVASVWDGPMIPLGCFCAAVTLGIEKRSKSHPFGQVGSLLLTVGGSIVVLLVDYMGGGHGPPVSAHEARELKSSSKGGVNEHMQFIQGNMVLMGVVAAYSATALLQKRLNHYPPIQLTAWMFGIAHVGCFTLLLVDGLLLGSKITGCSLGQALLQLHTALSTSPTFRYGLLYSAFFVGGACFSIGSYASSHLESSVITLFAATQPPITAVLEWIWEGKGLGWKKLGGMACVGLGMHFFTYIKRLEQHEMAEKQKHHNYQHSVKPQSYEKSNVEMSSSKMKRGSPNLTNRKAVADV